SSPSNPSRSRTPWATPCAATHPCRLQLPDRFQDLLVVRQRSTVGFPHVADRAASIDDEHAAPVRTFYPLSGFCIENAVERSDLAVEVAHQVPAEPRGAVELVQYVHGVDAAADDFGVELLELVDVHTELRQLVPAAARKRQWEDGQHGVATPLVDVTERDRIAHLLTPSRGPRGEIRSGIAHRQRHRRALALI